MKNFFNKNKYRRLKTVIFICATFVLVMFVASILNYCGGKMMEEDYKKALRLIQSENPKDINTAKEIFENLKSYENSERYLQMVEFRIDLDKIKEDYDNLKKVGNHSIESYQSLLTDIDNLVKKGTDNDVLMTEAESLKKGIEYDTAKVLYDEEEYESAMHLFQDVRDYNNSEYYLSQITLILYPNAQKSLYTRAKGLLESKKYQEALDIFEELGNYKDSTDQAAVCRRMILGSTVSAGIRATFYIDADRKIIHKGEVSDSLLNIGGYGEPVSISSCGNIVMVLEGDGTIHVYGEITNHNASYIESVPDIVQVATGEQYVVELDKEGKVYAVGHNGDGQIDAEKEWKDYTIKEIDCGWRTTVGLDTDGDVHIEGYRKDTYLAKINADKSEWKNIIHIATGGGGKYAKGNGHVVGLRKDKTVVATGDNAFGQCNTTDWKDIIKISAGDFHTVGLREDGKVYITNQGGFELKEFEEKIIDISAGLGYTIYVGESGKAYTDDDPYTEQGQVEGINDWEVYVE